MDGPHDWRYELTRDPSAATYWEDSSQWVWLKRHVVGRKGPRDGSPLLVALSLECCHAPLQGQSVLEAAPETFPTDDRDLDVCTSGYASSTSHLMT